MRCQYFGLDYSHYYRPSFLERLVDFFREVAVILLGMFLLFGGFFLGSYEDDTAISTLKTFISDVDRGMYDTLPAEFPEGITVNQLEKYSRRNYFLDVSMGNYTFRGTVEYGALTSRISFERTEKNFWEPAVMLNFFGLLCVILGSFWCVFKRSMGIKSLREINRENFVYGQR